MTIARVSAPSPGILRLETKKFEKPHVKAAENAVEHSEKEQYDPDGDRGRHKHEKAGREEFRSLMYRWDFFLFPLCGDILFSIRGVGRGDVEHLFALLDHAVFTAVRSPRYKGNRSKDGRFPAGAGRAVWKGYSGATALRVSSCRDGRFSTDSARYSQVRTGRPPQ